MSRYMNQKVFSPEERLYAAISHQKADRISCAPLIESYGARFAGIANHDFLYDEEQAFSALAAIRNEFPVWDIRRSIYFIHHGSLQNKIGLLKSKMPGVDLPEDYEYQVVEYEAMSREDYKIIINSGYKAYIQAFFQKAFGTTKEEAAMAEEDLLKLHHAERKSAEALGQVFLYGAHINFPAAYFTTLRSFPEFIRDTFKIPELLCEAISIATDDAIQECIDLVSKTGIPRAFIGVNRISSQFFSYGAFEKFVWPYLERFAHRLIDAGITPIYHLDNDWTRNLEYFQALPKHKIILELDGSTDIFLAHRLLGNRVCLLGDVSASRFVLGTPEDMKKYCRSLMMELGQENGFILGSGCTLPHNARHENVAAFFDTFN